MKCSLGKETDMKSILNGILVVLVAIGIFACVIPKAHAGTQDELRELLGEKQVVYNGVCYFKQDGGLTFKRDEMKVTKRCVVGMDLPDTTKHYVLVIGEQGATELLLYDETTKEQKTLWRKGTEV